MTNNFIAMACLLVSVLGGRAELIYDNTVGNLNTFNASLDEYGDEVHMAGTARTVTKFQFQYYGNFTPRGNETLTVRFYQNDGPEAFDRFPSPKTIIYESGPISISDGIHLVTISGLAIEVPSRFTWTVKVRGLSNRLNDRAGLMFNASPTVGASFDDFWEQLPDGKFGLFNYGANPISNFIARAYALPNPEVDIATFQTFGNGGYRLVVNGPIGESYWVETSEDLESWSRVQKFTMLASEQEQLVRIFGNSASRRFFRLALPDPVIEQVIRTSNETVLLKMVGPSGYSFPIQYSSNLIDWLDLDSVFFADPFGEYSDVVGPGDSLRFYRVLAR